MAVQTTLQKEGAFDADLRNAINTNFTNINNELAIINPVGGNINVPTGSTLVVVDSGAASMTNPKITTGILDANGNVSLALSATASAVNGLGVTNAATGNGTTNPVTLLPSGTDAAVALTITPKGAAGVLTLGLSTGTGDVVLGSSSGTQTVRIGNGAGISTVTIGNVTTAGSTVSMAGAATATGVTDTVNIATGATAGTGSKVVHIADGTPGGTGVTLVTIGTNGTAAAHVTTIQGGNGTGAIALTPQTTGTIVIGAAGGTGDIGLGTSSGTQTVRISNGAGICNTNIAMVTTAGSTTAIAGAVTAAGLTDQISIGLGNAAATGFKKVNICTGTPGTSGNNWVTIGGGTTSSATVNAVARSYQDWNYIATESGANNALVAALTDAAGNNVTVAAGLRISLKLAHSLQAGANTMNINSHGTDAIKKTSNPATDLTVTAVSGSVLTFIFDGTVWQCQGQ